MDDLINRQSAIAAADRADCTELAVEDVKKVTDEVVKENKKLLSAQTDLIAKMQNGIKATDADDAYSCGVRNGIRWCISLLNEKEPMYENCPSEQPKIIRCKDCKYWRREIYNGVEYFNFSYCDLNHHGDGNNFYCADAERKEE